MTRVELAVVNGTVVGSSGRRQANLGVREGKIVYVGTEPIEAEHEIDALGLVVLPGGIDTHVHLMDPGSPDREDFPTGTAAAARAGVTTIIEHTHGAPVRSAQDLAEKVAYLGGRSHVDFALAAHAWPGEHDAVNQLWRAGVAFFKVFTCTTHGIPGHDAAALLRHFRSTSAVGARSLVHCEDDSITADAERVLRGLGRVDGGILSEWRSRIAELTAVSVVSLLARATSAKVTIAHVSHPEVCDYILAERARGADIAAEACPQYFYLREDEVHELGALRKFTPPARANTADDEAAMWQLLARGALTHMSSDHAPSTMEHKCSGSIWDVHFGLPGIDTTFPALIDAAATGVIDWTDVARVYAEVPARLYGLWPVKGALNVGCDADLAIVDPHAVWSVDDDAIISKAGWSPYRGRPMVGRVVRTILRGREIAAGGEDPRSRSLCGRWLPGPGYGSRTGDQLPGGERGGHA